MTELRSGVLRTKSPRPAVFIADDDSAGKLNKPRLGSSMNIREFRTVVKDYLSLCEIRRKLARRCYRRSFIDFVFGGKSADYVEAWLKVRRLGASVTR